MAGSSSPGQLSAREILREPFRLIREHKRIFLLITLPTGVILPFIFLAGLLSSSSLSKNVSSEMASLSGMDPTSSEYLNQTLKVEKHAIIFTVVAIIFQLFIAVIASCATVTTVYTSAMSDLGKDLTLTGIYSKLKYIWVRALTCLSVALYAGGYFLMILPLILIRVLGKESIMIATVKILVILVAGSISLYIFLVWMLDLVSSVLEDCYGKDHKLVEERKGSCSISFAWVVIVGQMLLTSALGNDNPDQTVNTLMGTYVLLALLALANTVMSLVYMMFIVKRGWKRVETREVVDLEECRRVFAILASS